MCATLAFLLVFIQILFALVSDSRVIILKCEIFLSSTSNPDDEVQTQLQRNCNLLGLAVLDGYS